MHIICIGIIIGTLTLMISCGKEAPEEEALPQPEEQPAEPTITPEEKRDSLEDMTGEIITEPRAPWEVPGDRIYELQVVASRDYSKIFELKEKLEQLGYDVKITTTQKNGETFYRLRMKGLYTQSEAEKLGEQLKSQVPAVKDYWIAKVK